MASHTTIIDALNAICVAEGGAGGHRYMIDALNEWSLRRSGTGGHKYSINALNEIAGLIGASTGHKYDVDALNAIAVELGGVGGHYYYVNALNAVVDAEGGGEDEWVPAGAYIHIDFIGGSPQGRAWLEGTGLVDIDTLLGSDPNTENAWAATSYSSGNLTADGYLGPAAAFIGAAKTKILAGSTFVIRLKQIDEDTGSPAIGIASADGNSAVIFELLQNDLLIRGSAYSGSFLEDRPFVNSGPGGTNVMGVTLTTTRAEFTENGNAPEVHELTSAEYPTAGGSAIAAAFMESVGANAIISFTIYDPLPTSDGLDELTEV